MSSPQRITKHWSRVIIAILAAILAIIPGLVLAQSTSKDDDLGSRTLASTYVPLDSWVYPALLRLSALGFVQSQIAGLQPWTRMDCALQLQEAEDKFRENVEEQKSSDVAELLRALKSEFRVEEAQLEGQDSRRISLDSAYVRYTGIAGQPLNDSYHFGQTLINDFGRPYSQGSNVVTGASGRASWGRFALFVRGEYQHAPGVMGFSQSVRQVIADVDSNPIQLASATNQINRIQLLDTYASAAFGNLQVSFGKQSLWWGPGRSGPFLGSNNADPAVMLRVNQLSPIQLPGFLSYLGLIRTEFFIGKLEGHHFPSDPLMHGQKISFKVSPNLEFGFSRTTVFAGVGHPLTLGSFGRSLFSTVSSSNQFDERADPGDRRAGFDFSYRIPGLRDWLTLYSDSVADDDISPLAAPRRAGINPGIYLARLPKLHKFDLRLEAISTDPPTSRSNKGQFFYWNDSYHDAYTNNGNIIGNAVGREAKGFQAWSSYWYSASTKIQIGYRHTKLAKDFIPGGGTQDNVAARADFKLRPEVDFSCSLQAEQWRIPLLTPQARRNLVSSFQLTFRPQSK